jgi:ABC-type polysaccharide/polyol phosphate export permease
MLIGVSVSMLALGVVVYSGRAVAVDPEMRPLGIGLSIVCLPLLVLLQAVFMLGIGSFLAAFNLILRDTHHVIGVILTVWMFGTPIVYPALMVEKTKFSWVLDINPVHWMVESYRDVLLYASWPRPEYLLAFAGASALTLFLGMRFFLAQKPRFPDLL